MNLNYESGKVGDYKGIPVYTIKEIKFEPKRAIYALGHQGTSGNLNLIFWDGNVWRQLGSDVKENRPVYSFAQKEEDWLIKEEKKLKSKPAEHTNVKTIRVEEIEDLTTLSAGIDDYIQSQLNRDW